MKNKEVTAPKIFHNTPGIFSYIPLSRLYISGNEHEIDIYALREI
jgi:hypothetical protein